MRFYLAIVVQGEEDVVVVFPVFKALCFIKPRLNIGDMLISFVVEPPPETSDTRRSMERRACLLV